MILFLEFEGVLRTDRSPRDELEGQLIANFCSVLRRFRRIEVVLSTEWRLRQRYDALLAWFHRDLHPRFLGRTPQLRDPGPWPRQAEILAWLQRNGHQERPWFALDANAMCYPEGCSELVLCNPAAGLDLEATDSLVERITARMVDHLRRRSEAR